jgi:hypothetical protein
MTSALRIIVTGLAATYPFGGVFWDYLQYPLGLRRLGHDVLYIEDTGKWCYDPRAGTFVEDGAWNASYLGREIANLDPDLANRWFFRDSTGKTYGRSWKEVTDFCNDADLFIHISASCWMREEYFAAKRVAFIDSDPMYTQASVPEYIDGSIDDESRERVEMLRRHDVFFTFGENVNHAACRIPKEVFNWIPTRQPIVLDCFAGAAVPVPERRRVLTTVASWKSAEGSRVVDGVTYEGKGVEFERFIDFPSRSSLPIELAMSGQAPADRLRAHGWRMTDAYAVSRDPWVYRDYLARSFGEWSVAKNAYVASRSGWFSCRTACYLALGVPAVVQDTHFGVAVPTGQGVLKFSNPEEASEAIDEISRNPDRHSKAATEISREYFDSGKVLTQLIEKALNGHG